MNKFIDAIFEKVPEDILTENTVALLLNKGANSRYNRLKRAVGQGELIRIRRGLYLLAKKYQRRSLNLYQLAQVIYGPSYVSFESALSYHGWIPEGVYTVTSACIKRAQTFETPLGRFSYNPIPSTPFYTGVERLGNVDEGIFLMATPWKALADYVSFYKKDWVNLDPVRESLRVEEDSFKESDPSILKELATSYSSHRVQRFLKGIQKELS